MQRPKLDNTYFYLDRMNYLLEFIRTQINDCSAGGCMGMKTANIILFALAALIDLNRVAQDEVNNVDDFLGKLENQK